MLQFDEKRLMADLIKSLNREMDKVANILLGFMIGEIASIPSSGIKSVGKPDWRADVIDALKVRSKAESLSIVKEIGLLDQSQVETIYKGMILDFGMGKTSDKSNPWLDEYLSSEYYHSERNGMSVYGREGEQVFDIDTGMWKDSTANHSNEIPHFRQVGSHFWTNIFGNSSTLAKQYFDEAIETAISDLDFSKYIVDK